MVARRKRQQEEEKPVPLRVLREKTGLSQAKLAAALGIDPATISRCERGLTEPSLTINQLKLLALLAGISSVAELPDHLGRSSSATQN